MRLHRAGGVAGWRTAPVWGCRNAKPLLPWGRFLSDAGDRSVPDGDSKPTNLLNVTSEAQDQTEYEFVVDLVKPSDGNSIIEVMLRAAIPSTMQCRF